MKTERIEVEYVDVNGSLRRLARDAPSVLRKRLMPAVLLTAGRLAKRMAANAPVGPDAPHLRDTVTFTQRGLSAEVGYIRDHYGADPAADGSDATNAEVAFYNEYVPNEQPFMRNSAHQESSAFVERISEAAASIEKGLGFF